MRTSSGPLTADEACQALGVSKATVYAYVSRGLIRAVADSADSRRSLYDPRDVQALIERNSRGRTRRAIAASTVNWGDPILSSSITNVADGHLRYRGVDAVALSAWRRPRSFYGSAIRFPKLTEPSAPMRHGGGCLRTRQ